MKMHKKLLNKKSGAKQTVCLINLGCPKNLVDAETLLGYLSPEKFKIIGDINKAQIGIVNTCCFIEDAKAESLDAIFQVNELKKSGLIKVLLVTGCLPQRYKKRIFRDLKEVDAFIGPGNYSEIDTIISGCLKSKRILKVNPNPDFNSWYRPVQLTPAHYSYLKISDGCSNRCSYCSIPLIRGPYKSKPFEILNKEISVLSANKKIKEINIIGQDTTAYGHDLKNGHNLIYLLKIILKETDIPWIRLLYTHPNHISDELIDLIKSEKRICKYIDLPLQHINDRILTKMNRRAAKKHILNLLGKIRKMIHGISIRTTFIVGFPSETDTEFRELIDFVSEEKFERLGAFIYSPEEGTRAFSFIPKIPESIKHERFDTIMSLQKNIALNKNKELVGRNIRVLIDGPVQKRKNSFPGRTESDAPEIDNTVWVKENSKIKQGNFYTVNITKSKPYDLYGEII